MFPRNGGINIRIKRDPSRKTIKMKPGVQKAEVKRRN
jgi:hypothetical protein